jgi:3'-phosphoadenosine 5'-phosphosulfate sulfotransferase (PAPS reductase)/FAD synthetase
VTATSPRGRAPPGTAAGVPGPALLRVDALAPPALPPVAVRDLKRGDVCAPGSFTTDGITFAEPVLVIGSAVPALADFEPGRVTFAYRALNHARGDAAVLPEDITVHVVGRDLPARMSAGVDFRSRVLRANRHTTPGVAGLVDPVNLHDYDVVLVSISAGKDSMALLVAVVELALAQGYDLGRIIAVHCDLGRVEWAGTAELAAEHAREMDVHFVRVANKVDLLDQVRQRKRNLVRKAGELREAAEDARAVGDVAAASLLAAQSAKKAATPTWFSSAARYCTKSQKTGEVEKLMTALVKVWREAGNTDRPIRILNTLGIRADESPARALKKPFGPNSAINTRRTVTRWLPIFTWSEAQVWATIRASGLRVHGAYQINMSRLSCALCVLGSRQDLVTSARANRGLVDEYTDVEDEVEATFLNGISVREIGAGAARLGPLELPAPASLRDLESEFSPSHEHPRLGRAREVVGVMPATAASETCQVERAFPPRVRSGGKARSVYFGGPALNRRDCRIRQWSRLRPRPPGPARRARRRARSRAPSGPCVGLKFSKGALLFVRLSSSRSRRPVRYGAVGWCTPIGRRRVRPAASLPTRLLRGRDR